jgi:flagellar biosynthesis GTPase FlhF
MKLRLLIGLEQIVAQTSKSAVSRVAKPASAPCRFGNRRHSRFGNLRYFFVAFALLAAQAARAQTAEDFFNGGAQFYISNNIPAALEKTETGLKLYPDDVKLKKLEELLKQQQQQQSQQNQQNQQNQSQQQKNSSGQQNQRQQNQQQNQQAKNQSKQQKQQPAQSSAGRFNERQNEQNESAQAQASNRMTPEEAKRLLDSQKGDEQFLQPKPSVPPPDGQQPIEDW